MIKIFGAAFDPLDIAERLDIKVAYVNWLESHGPYENNFLDPYEFLETNVRYKYPKINKVEWIGKFPIDTWLSPKPLMPDLKSISQEKYTEFLDNNGCYDCCNELVNYLRRNMTSCIPFMIGVDHCLTGGVLKYLKERYNEFNVLVFDSHCDLIDLETKKYYYKSFLKDFKTSFEKEDIYECGNFLSYMLTERIVRPENLWIMGAQDLDKIKQNSEHFYSKKILPWIEQGLHVISKEDLILTGIPDEIEGRTYISFDMDLGSLASVFAARFLNYFGLNLGQFMGLVRELSEKIRTKKIDLIGLDIVEIDIHFLGADINGNKDHTAEIASEIVDRVIYGNFKQ